MVNHSLTCFHPATDTSNHSALGGIVFPDNEESVIGGAIWHSLQFADISLLDLIWGLLSLRGNTLCWGYWLAITRGSIYQ